MTNKPKVTERGWCAHFICADRCTFHRNTLIEYNSISIVVSSVGAMLTPYSKKQPMTIGADRYYETMVWFATDDYEFKDADVEKGQLDFDYPEVPIPWDEINANNIHDRMVEKWIEKIKTIKQ